MGFLYFCFFLSFNRTKITGDKDLKIFKHWARSCPVEELLSLLRACNEPSLGPLMAATVAEDRGGHRCTDGNPSEFWQLAGDYQQHWRDSPTIAGTHSADVGLRLGAGATLLEMREYSLLAHSSSTFFAWWH